MGKLAIADIRKIYAIAYTQMLGARRLDKRETSKMTKSLTDKIEK